MLWNGHVFMCFFGMWLLLLFCALRLRVCRFLILIILALLLGIFSRIRTWRRTKALSLSLFFLLRRWLRFLWEIDTCKRVLLLPLNLGGRWLQHFMIKLSNFRSRVWRRRILGNWLVLSVRIYLPLREDLVFVRR